MSETETTPEQPKGRIYMSGDHGTVFVTEGEPPPDWAVVPAVVPELPAESASKALWAAYAEALGIEGYDAMTKAALIEATTSKGQ